MDHTYAATARTAASDIGALLCGGIPSPVYDREAGTPCFTCSMRDSYVPGPWSQMAPVMLGPRSVPRPTSP